MQPSRVRFETRLSELRDFLDLVDLLEGLRQQTPVAPAAASLVSAISTPVWRRQVYSFSIVSLYGAHERFFRDSLEATAKLLASLHAEYKEIPERVRHEHARLNAASIKEVIDRDPGDIETALQLMARFSDSLAGAPVLNEALFAKHTANFRVAVVQQSFARLGLHVVQR